MRNKTGFIYTLLFVGIIIFLCLISCTKEDEPQPTPQPSVEQDQNLLGSWAQDSSKMDGSQTGYSTEPDSIHITPEFLKKVSYMNYGTPYQSKTTSKDNWTTKGDSLILSSNGVEGNHYWYGVQGNTLKLYLKSKYSNNVQYFYHR